MVVRRAFYYAQAVAAFALPAWLLVGWGVFGGGGLTLLLVIMGSVALTVAMLVAGGITIARRTVREQRAVSWVDAGILFVWYASIVATGFYLPWGGVLVACIILAGLAAFWAAIVQLFSDAGRRARTLFASFSPPMGGAPRAASVPPSAGAGYRPPAATPSPYADGEYIVIETSRDRERRGDS